MTLRKAFTNLDKHVKSNMDVAISWTYIQNVLLNLFTIDKRCSEHIDSENCCDGCMFADNESDSCLFADEPNQWDAVKMERVLAKEFDIGLAMNTAPHENKE